MTALMMTFLHEGRLGPLSCRPGNGRARLRPIRLTLLVVALLFGLMVSSQAQSAESERCRVVEQSVYGELGAMVDPAISAPKHD